MNPVKRIGLLAGILTAGFSTIFLLPKTPPIKDTRLAAHLPEKFGEWGGKDVAIGDKELTVLAGDTRFERKSYSQRYNSTAPPVEVSIVFSGKDLNNSIHRPETCLTAAGWRFVRLRYHTVPGSGGRPGLPVKEMLCKKPRHDEKGQPVMLPDGKQLEDWMLLYYTFIGHNEITPGHYSRTFIDIRDRVIGGYDQTWAYATFSTKVTGKYVDQGASIGYMTPMSIDQTGDYLAEFINSLTPAVLAPPPKSSNDVASTR